MNLVARLWILSSLEISGHVSWHDPFNDPFYLRDTELQAIVYKKIVNVCP